MNTRVKQAVTPLLEQQLALSTYLDALLTDEKQAPHDTAVARVSTESSAATPAWADEPFQCLVFKLADMRIAAPLSELNGILEWDGTAAAVPGRPAWTIGMLRNRDQNVQLVDAATLILPPGHRAGGAQPAQRHVALIDDRRWGLVVDEIAEVTVIDPAQVRWRTPNTRRRWLAGTVVDQLCALLDVGEFAGQLERGWREGDSGAPQRCPAG